LFAGIKKRKKNSYDQDGYYWNIEAGLFPTVALYLIIHLIHYVDQLGPTNDPK